MKNAQRSFVTNSIYILIISISCILINLFIYYTGGTSGSWPQLNYIPILAAAYLWAEKGSIIVAFFLGFIIGPFMPLNRFEGIMQTPENWIIRLLIYLFVAYITGYILNKNKKYEHIIEESYQRSHFNGLYNSNKLISDLDYLMDNNVNFHLVFLNIINLEDISKYVDYRVMNQTAKYCIDKLLDYFKMKEVYSITENEYILVVKNDAEHEINFKIFNYLQQFNNPIEIEGYLFRLVLKIGLLKYDMVKTDPIELFNKARIAADQGDNNISASFNYDTDYDLKRKLYNEISGSLIHAIRKRELFLVFQPIIDLKNNCISSGEALIRWDRGDRTPVGPNVFIPIAEETGSIKIISKWVFVESMSKYLKWKEQGLDMKYSINITANELLDDSFRKWAWRFIDKKNVNYKNFGIEVTERVLSKDNKKLNNILSSLKEKGFIIEIDDFGTGYNSLMTIGEIPFDIIKIDKYFIDRIFDRKIKIIVERIINAIHMIGGLVIAEGVETKEQFLTLKELGCDKIQGYYFSKPLLSQDFFEYCTSFDINNYY